MNEKDRLIASLQAELKSAKENENRLNTLIQAAPICIHEINLQGQITSMNQAGLDMIAVDSSEDVCGIYYLDFVCKKQKKEINKLLEKAYQGEYNKFEFTPENSELVFSSCFAPVFNEEGNVERIMGLTENITAQKKQEIAISHSENKYRNIFENADISIWEEDMSQLYSALENLRKEGITDLSKYLSDNQQKVREFSNLIRVVSVNTATLEMFEVNSELNFLNQIQTSFGADAIKVFEKELKAIWNGESFFRSEASFVSETGREISAIISFRIPESQEGFQSVPVSIVDVTLQKQIEEELLKSTKLDSIGFLAGGIAHDFNNILAGLYGNLELAKLKLKGQHPALKHIEIANQAMEKATHLTKQLLTFAKGGDPIFEMIDVKEVVQDAINFSLSGSKVKTTLTLQQNLWPLYADKGLLSQVITNLLINAEQAMPKGGNLTVEAINTGRSSSLPLHFSDHYVRIKVSDEGVGISKEKQKYIFDPYFTTKKSGNGLGLATVKRIISKHNGHIYVESEQDKGTVFTIHLPAKTEKGVELTNPPATHSATKISGNILVMDDDDMILSMLTEMLNTLGYNVQTATDGDEVLKKYVKAQESGKQFDAVIMDLTVPGGKGGKEAIKLLLNLNPAVKVIVSSGYSNDSVMANYTNYGFKGRLVKPFRLNLLDKELHKVLSLN